MHVELVMAERLTNSVSECHVGMSRRKMSPAHFSIMHAVARKKSGRLPIGHAQCVFTDR